MIPWICIFKHQRLILWLQGYILYISIIPPKIFYVIFSFFPAFIFHPFSRSYPPPPSTNVFGIIYTPVWLCPKTKYVKIKMQISVFSSNLHFIDNLHHGPYVRDVNSEHVAHTWKKICHFGEIDPTVTARSNQMH